MDLHAYPNGLVLVESWSGDARPNPTRLERPAMRQGTEGETEKKDEGKNRSKNGKTLTHRTFDHFGFMQLVPSLARLLASCASCLCAGEGQKKEEALRHVRWGGLHTSRLCEWRKLVRYQTGFVVLDILSPIRLALAGILPSFFALC